MVGVAIAVFGVAGWRDVLPGYRLPSKVARVRGVTQRTVREAIGVALRDPFTRGVLSAVSAVALRLTEAGVCSAATADARTEAAADRADTVERRLDAHLASDREDPSHPKPPAGRGGGR